MAREMGSASVSASGSPTLSQYINLSDYAYTSGLTPPNPTMLSKLGLEPLTQNGRDVASLDSLTGFYGQAFVTTGAKPDVIIAFEGTNVNGPNPLFVAAQIADDANIVLGQPAYSYGSALAFTQKALADAASQGIGASNVFLTGHSLGAAEAEYVASETGLAGATFGTPGIVAKAGAPASHLHNYVEHGDPVGNYASNSPDVLGDIVQSPAIRHYGATTLVGAKSHAANLRLARFEYNHGDPGGAAALLALNAERYHPLATYAKDLNVKLYGEDFSAGSDTAFFNSLGTSSLLKLADAPVCFAQGTRIRTLRGEVAVEHLEVGDVALTATGDRRPVIWTGHRRLGRPGIPLPAHQQPIRIRAGAFAPGCPRRDLHLSPGHPVLVGADAAQEGGHLVPIMCLVNGTSIVREAVATITYWHVELDAHDILLAEGLPAESYLDWGDRPFFVEGSDHALANPDFVVPGLGRRCRPVACDGPVVEAARRRLDATFASKLSSHCAWDRADRATWIAG